MNCLVLRRKFKDEQQEIDEDEEQIESQCIL